MGLLGALVFDAFSVGVRLRIGRAMLYAENDLRILKEKDKEDIVR